jgi:hypothetical protein
MPKRPPKSTTTPAVKPGRASRDSTTAAAPAITETQTAALIAHHEPRLIAARFEVEGLPIGIVLSALMGLRTQAQVERLREGGGLAALEPNDVQQRVDGRHAAPVALLEDDVAQIDVRHDLHPRPRFGPFSNTHAGRRPIPATARGASAAGVASSIPLFTSGVDALVVISFRARTRTPPAHRTSILRNFPSRVAFLGV